MAGGRLLSRSRRRGGQTLLVASMLGPPHTMCVPCGLLPVIRADVGKHRIARPRLALCLPMQCCCTSTPAPSSTDSRTAPRSNGHTPDDETSGRRPEREPRSPRTRGSRRLLCWPTESVSRTSLDPVRLPLAQANRQRVGGPAPSVVEIVPSDTMELDYRFAMGQGTFTARPETAGTPASAGAFRPAMVSLRGRRLGIGQDCNSVSHCVCSFDPTRWPQAGDPHREQLLVMRSADGCDGR
jgi:hypothetical protein